MRLAYLLLLGLVSNLAVYAQPYTSYRVGSDVSATVQHRNSILLMGGGTDVDLALRSFLNDVTGGDVLILRASGGDGYNSYFYSELNQTLNSVETIVLDAPAAASDPYVIQRVNEAEAVWIAGGNQWTYLNEWQSTPLNTALNSALRDRNISIGGTSAGAVALGGLAFTARNGTVYSKEALQDPYNEYMTLSTIPFLDIPELRNVLIDTHFDNRDRKGRLLAFLAKLRGENEVLRPRAIALNEQTAVLIRDGGVSVINAATNDDEQRVYFVQLNCSSDADKPEVLAFGQPLTWDPTRQPVVAYQARAFVDVGSQWDLSAWVSGEGSGSWEAWGADKGAFAKTTIANPASCLTSGLTNVAAAPPRVAVWPNPATSEVRITAVDERALGSFVVLDVAGKTVLQFASPHAVDTLDVSGLGAGTYFLHDTAPGIASVAFVVVR